MPTQTLNPPTPLAASPATPAVSPNGLRTVTPPDPDWVPVAFPKGAWKRWLRRRKRGGRDRPDEVWNGVYVVMPDPNLQHQEISLKIAAGMLILLQGGAEARVFPGCNVSDDPDDWTKSYRCPDVAVYLAENPSEDRHTHWLGGPDFAVEVVSKGDRSHDKFEFYARVGVRELLYLERQPWALDLYRRDGSNWTLVGRSDAATSAVLESAVLPVNFRLIPADPHPRIEMVGRDGRGPWLA